MFRAMLEQAPLSIAFWDVDLRFLHINELAASMNGPSPDQHVGRTFREVMGPDLADKVEPVLRGVLETGQPVVDLEVTGTWPAGGPRFFLASFHPVLARAGEVVGVAAIGLDVTDRRLFLDAKEREHQALEINDNIVQGLTVALMALETGNQVRTRQALEATLDRARDIIGDLIGTAGGNVHLGRGRLRRTRPAPNFLAEGR